MVTYVNDLRLSELATGEGSGTWGTTTNTNLELIGEALGYGTQNCFSSDANATTTVADGSTDPARAMYFKVTSSATLSATRELTIAPNTLNRVMIIENATTGSQIITIKQGSGNTVNVGSGAVKVLYLDGAGAGAAVQDALVDLDLTGTTTAVTVTASGVITGLTVEATGDTSAGDNAAMGYTSAEGLILTGQGSSTDVTVKNDADATVMSIATGTTQATFAGEVVAASLDISGNIDVDGTTNLDAVDIDGAVQIDSTVTVGVDDTGHDVKFFGASSGAYMLWDESTDDLILGGASRLGIGTTAPGSNLHIESASSPTLRLVDTTNDATLLAYAQDSEGVVGTYSNHSLGLYANSNRAMTIDANLDVGIGTTSVDAKLHVQQGGEPPAEGMLILEANSASRQLRIQPPTNSDNGFIAYHGGNLTFIDDGTEVARFQGTTSFNVSGRFSVGYANSSSAINNGIQILTGGIGGGVQLNRETGIPSSGESLGSYAWKGQDGANTNAAAECLIDAITTEDHSGSTAATKMVFQTKNTGTGPGNSPATALTLEANQNATFVGVVTCVSVTETSDAALKTDVRPIENALATVSALKGVTYKDKATGDKRIGFLAQDVQRDAPDLAERVVLEADPETKMLGISYSHMTSVLAEAIKEQSAQIQTLKTRVEELEN